MPRVTLDPKERKRRELKRFIIGEMQLQNLTQSELADGAGVTQQAISRFLKTDADIHYSTLVEIFRFLKVDESDVIRLMT